MPARLQLKRAPREAAIFLSAMPSILTLNPALTTLVFAAAARIYVTFVLLLQRRRSLASGMDIGLSSGRGRIAQ